MTTVLITGVNAGIGRGLLEKYLLRPQHTVIGSVRDAKSAAAKELHSLPTAEGTKLILVSIESTSPTDAADAIKELQAQGIDKIDVLIANAGVYRSNNWVADVPWEEIVFHADVNVGGVLRIFQASLPLLKKAPQPKFVAVSSIAGSITAQTLMPFPNVAYGVSKTMLNYVAYRAHLDHKDLTVIIVHPGAVKTERAVAAFQKLGVTEEMIPLITTEESVNQVLKRVDTASRDVTSGVFLNYDGGIVPW